jgi:predicted metal-dependent hydrolase
MSISKNLLPNTNPGQTISLQSEPKSKKAKTPNKNASIVKAVDPPAESIRNKIQKSRILLQEQSEFQARTDAALAQIPDILSELRNLEKNIQKNIFTIREEQLKFSQQVSEELKWLKDAHNKAEQLISRSFKLMACAVVVFIFIGIYLIYDSHIPSKFISEKISGIESVVQQNEIKNELRETRGALSDAIRINEQSINMAVGEYKMNEILTLQLTSHMKWLKSLGKEGERLVLQKCNLENENFEGFNLSESFLLETDFNNSLMKNIDFNYSNLNWSSFRFARIYNA